ncbi:MAG TPA: PAS domain S-box protein [bacterium]|nr:PAS domain S-box protein [bacterium]
MTKENKEKPDVLSAFALFPDAVLVIGNRGRILYLNDAAADLFLLNREKALNKQAQSLIGAPFDKETLSQIRKDLKKQGAWRGEAPSPLQPNGSLEWTISRIEDPQFRSLTMLAVARSVCAPTRAPEASDDPRINEIIRTSPLGVHTYELRENNKLVFTGYNKAAEHILGIDMQPFVGLTIEEAFPMLVETEIPAAYRAVAMYQETYAGKQVYRDENGIIGSFELTAFYTGHRRIAVLFHDVTENEKIREALLEKQDQLRSFIDNSQVGILIADEEGHIIEWNKACEQLMSTKANRILGRKIWDVVMDVLPSDQRSEAFRAHLRQLITGTLRLGQLLIPESGEYQAQTAGGKILTLQRNLFLTKSQTGYQLGVVLIDVTERRLAETELRLREQMLSGITQNLPGVLYRFYGRPKTGEMGVYYISGRSKALFGIDANVDDFFQEFYQRIHPEDQPAFMQSIQEVIAHCEPWQFEGRYYHPNGSLFWFRGMSQPTRQDDEIVFDGLMLDITEQKIAETELRLREELLSSLTRNIPGGVYRFYARNDSRDMGLYYISEKAKIMFGIDWDMNNFFGEFVNHVHPEDQELFAQSIYRAIEQCEPWEYEGRFIHNDGSLIWFRAISQPTKLENEIFFDGLLLNVTEQKRIERERERLVEIIENSPDFIGMADAQGNGQYVNPAGLAMTGYTAEEYFSNPMPIREMQPDLPLEVLTIASEKGVWSGETTIRHKDGRNIVLSQIVTAQRDKSGKVESYATIARDITEKNKAENELRRSEERYRNFIANAGEGIFRIDFQQPISIDQPYEDIAAQIAEHAVIAEVNEALSRMYNLTPAKMVGLPVRRFAPDCGHQMADLLSMENNRTTELESLEYTIDGQPLYIVESFSAVIENGFIQRVWGVQRDVTERKKMELAIQESEKRYTDIFNSVQDALIIHDLDGNVVNVNDTMLKMYGVTREQAQTMHVFTDLTGPGNPEHSGEVWLRVMAGESLIFEWSARRPGDDSVFPAEVRLSKITLGEQDLILSNVRDITERKAAEKALREKTEELDRYFTSSLDLLCIADMQGYFRRLNPEWKKTLGYEFDELVDRPFLDLVHPDDLPATLDAISALSDKTEILNFTNRYRCKNGEYRWLEWRSYPSGNMIYAVARDITQHKTVEAMLQKSEQRAQRLRSATITLSTDQSIAAGRIDEAMRMLTETAAGAMNVARIGIWLFSEDGNQMRCLDLYKADEKQHTSGAILNADRYPNYFEAIKREKSINADHARSDPRSRELTESYLIPQGITSLLDTGIFLGGKLVGVVCLEHIGKPREWKTEEIAFSGTVADQATQALANAERLAAEDALRQSEMRYRSYVDHAPVGVLVVDDHGRYVEINDAACRMSGYDKDELLQLTIEDLLASESRERGLAHYRQVVETGFAAGELAFRRKDGSTRYWTVDAVRLTDDRFLGFATDITQRKLDEETRRLNEIRREAMLQLNQMVGNTPNEITDYTLEAIVRITGSALGYIAFLNETEDVLIMYSWSKTAMELCAVEDRTHIYPLEATGLWGEAVRRRRPIVTNDYQAPNPHKRGYPPGHVAVKRHLNLPIFERDKIVVIVGVGNKIEPYNEEDINQITLLMNFMWSIIKRQRAEESLRESEEKYRSLVETTDTGFVIIDGRDGRIIETNDNYRRLAGKDSLDEIIGHSVIEWTADYDKDRNALAVQQCLDQGYTRHFNVDYIHADGRIVTIEVNGTTFTTNKGIVILALCRDVTEYHQQEARLRHQQKLESIGTLAGGIAHEINNPINIILNYAQLLHEAAPENSQTALDAKAIADESRRIAGIVKNLLSFSRQENERHSPASMDDIIHSTLSLTQKLLAKDQIKVELTIEENLPKLKCRSQQIMQVLMNLLTNARDALNQKFPQYDPEKRIVIACATVEHDDKRWIRTSVEDFGVGIPLSIRNRMFDPFFTTKPKDKGTGLGLSITHGIIEEHKGLLWFESELGGYTKFSFDLPLDNGWHIATEENER